MHMTQKLFLSANEAVALGARYAGCRVAAAYPGTPSTEIMESVSKYKDAIYCEWSVNEKVAMEVAIGAALAGGRALTAMKHVGLNVAMDPLMTITYVGVLGGLVLVSADDPGMHSSQNEQDNRNLAKFARIPLFEPADSQEAFDMTREAFELSERLQTPVMIRLTTRTSHTSCVVEVEGDMPEAHPLVPYEKNIRRTIPVPAHSRAMRLAVEERTAALAAESGQSAFNVEIPGNTDFGFIASGVAYQYVREVFPEYATLKLGFSWPLPLEKIRAFAAKVKQLIVLEESDPFIADGIRAAGIPVLEPKTELHMLELNPMRLQALRAALLGGEPPVPAPPAADVPARPPVLCAGCSHRGVFHILSKLKATVTGDIGCYTLGAFPPLYAMDSTICMGAAVGNAIGMRKAGLPNPRIAAVLGDSTFFHSGITGTLDLAYNKGNVTLVVLDNRITAMTGHQQNPGSGLTLMGEHAKSVRIVDIVKACGIEKAVEVDAYDLEALESTLKEHLDAQEPSVVVVKGPCVVYLKMVGKNGRKVDASKCIACGRCFKLGCPAIFRGEAVADGKRFKSTIDLTLCTGCTLCEQVCPSGAISPVKAGNEGVV